MELPAYHLPRLTNLYRSVMSRARAFVQKAGTIIFLSCVLLWFLSNFNFGLQMVDENDGMLRGLGTVTAPVFAPLGFGDWHATVATLAGLIAKENCVGTLHISFGAGSASGFGQALRATYPAMAGYAFWFSICCVPHVLRRLVQCTRSLVMHGGHGVPWAIKLAWLIFSRC